jgi:hypothetical protein
MVEILTHNLLFLRRMQFKKIYWYSFNSILTGTLSNIRFRDDKAVLDGELGQPVDRGLDGRLEGRLMVDGSSGARKLAVSCPEKKNLESIQ